MPTSILLVRHGVRGIPDKVTLADGKIVDLQDFSKVPLPFYSYPPYSVENNNGLSGQGWKFAHQLGCFLKKQQPLLFSRKIKVRANVSLERTVSTGVAIARGAEIKDITMAKGSVDALFSPQEAYGYTLPDSAVVERQERYNVLIPEIKAVSQAITRSFGVPLPPDTTITKTTITGLVAIEDRFSQEPIMSLYSDIRLPISRKNAFEISRGIVLRQQIEFVPIYLAQTVSLLATYIVRKLHENKGDLDVLVGRDNSIAGLADLLSYSFQTHGLPKQFVNVLSGLLFTYDEKSNKVRVAYLSFTLDSNWQFSRVKGPYINRSLRKFTTYVLSKVTPQYVDFSLVDNVSIKRVS